jgi:hypothetical protein
MPPNAASGPPFQTRNQGQDLREKIVSTEGERRLPERGSRESPCIANRASPLPHSVRHEIRLYRSAAGGDLTRPMSEAAWNSVPSADTSFALVTLASYPVLIIFPAQVGSSGREARSAARQGDGR